MSKIHRILMTDARAERVVTRNPIVRAERVPTPTLRATHAPFGRKPKPKIPYQSIFGGGVWGEPLKK